MNGERYIENFEKWRNGLCVLRDHDTAILDSDGVAISQVVTPWQVDELVRLARLGLEAERRGKDHEARCIAFVATVGRTIRDDKATISLYNTDGEVKFLVETPGGLAFKGRAGELLDALDNCIDEGWVP